MKQLLNLDGNWTLYLAPHKSVCEKAFSASTAEELKASKWTKIPAEVPGNFELDLHRAGLFPDPYFGTNTLLCQKEENKHLWYVKSFSLPTLPENETFLRFEGIDTFAEIYLNGKQIGTCDNMLVEHEYPATNLKSGKNELVVHILPTTIMARQYESNIKNSGLKYNCDSLNVRKVPSMFGWDIMPRIISGGIWRSVTLIEKPADRLEEFYLATGELNVENRTAKLHGYVRINTPEELYTDLTVVIKGVCRDHTFEVKQKVWSVNRTFSIKLTDCYFWWPRKVGEQNLYDVEVTLYKQDKLCDTLTTRLGIRTISLEHTSVLADDGSGKFEFVVNGKKVFILGTNWVPLDAFPSQNEKRLIRALEMVENIGCNMIRLWGGNLYECDAFYNWCDEHGIMLWQDFIMGCGYYPQDERFQEVLRAEAITAVKRLRSHASLALWAGDNECDAFAYGTRVNGKRLDPNDNVLTRKVLPEVLQIYDGYRDYLPSSPYIDRVAFSTGKKPPEDHVWGPRNYFKSDYYKNTPALFASETGFHGCPSPDSLKKFIGKDHLWPHMRECGRPDEEWTVHAASMELEEAGPYEYRIGLMNRQVAELFDNCPKESIEQIRTSRSDTKKALRFFEKICDMFGNSPAALNDYARASQIFQAEAFKYIIERFRIRKATHGGLIWWNLVDGWPQISDAVVDYYFCKKLAYDYIVNSQQSVCLMFDEPADGRIALYAANELPRDFQLSYTVRRVSDGTTVCAGQCELPADGILAIDSLAITETEKEAYLIEWNDGEGLSGRNHYVTNIQGISYHSYMEFLMATEIGHFEGFSEGENT